MKQQSVCVYVWVWRGGGGVERGGGDSLSSATGKCGVCMTSMTSHSSLQGSFTGLQLTLVVNYL